MFHLYQNNEGQTTGDRSFWDICRTRTKHLRTSYSTSYIFFDSDSWGLLVYHRNFLRILKFVYHILSSQAAFDFAQKITWHH